MKTETRCSTTRRGEQKSWVEASSWGNKGLAHVKQMREKASEKLSVLKFEHCATIDDEGVDNLLNFQF